MHVYSLNRNFIYYNKNKKAKLIIMKKKSNLVLFFEFQYTYAHMHIHRYFFYKIISPMYIYIYNIMLKYINIYVCSVLFQILCLNTRTYIRTISFNLIKLIFFKCFYLKLKKNTVKTNLKIDIEFFKSIFNLLYNSCEKKSFVCLFKI